MLLPKSSGGWCNAVKARFADEHGLSLSRIGVLASEASRRMQGAANSPEREGALEVERITSMTNLEEITDLAVQRGQLQAGVNAIRTKAEISGLIQPASNKVTNISIDLGGARFSVGPTQQVALVESCYRFLTEKHPELAEEFARFVSEALAGPQIIDAGSG